MFVNLVRVFMFILGKQRKVICDNVGNRTLNCTDPGTSLVIHEAKFGQEKSQISLCMPNLTSFSDCKQLSSSVVNINNYVKSQCQGKTWCSLSAQNMIRDPCPASRKYLDIKYSCQMSQSVHDGKCLLTYRNYMSLNIAVTVDVSILTCIRGEGVISRLF